MSKIKSLFVALFFTNSLLAGPIWQAMELFEQGQFAESAVIFGPYCKLSPFAYYYCEYLAQAGHLPRPLVDAITELKHALAQMANEPFAASLAYREVMTSTGTKQKAAINHLIDLAEQSTLGNAFYLLAKLPEDSSIKRLINKASKASVANGKIKASKDQKTSLHLLAAENFEFRSVAELVKIYPKHKIKERKIEDYQTIFKRSKPEYEQFESIHLQMTHLGLDSAKHELYGSASLREMGAFFGSVELQSYLGNVKSKSKDYLAMSYWFSWAAENGYPDALASLSNLYSRGEHVKSNQELAFKYALKGSPLSLDAKKNLGIFYEQGLGTEANPLKAAKIFLEIYEVDQEKYKYCARFAGNSLSLAQSYVEAEKWYQTAYASYQDLEAALSLAKVQLYKTDKEKGLGLLFKLSDHPEYRDKVAPMIAEYILNCILEGNEVEFGNSTIKIQALLEKHILLFPEESNLFYALGVIYRIGALFGRDLATAEKYLKRAALLGETRAWIQLGYIQEEHTRDFAKAVAYYQQAYDAGQTHISNHLGYCLKELGHDDARAVSLFQHALENKNSLGAWNLAQMHFLGRGGLTPDGYEMIRLLEISFAGDHDALGVLQIGDIYLNGLHGVKKDLSLAKKYYSQAGELGNPYGRMMSIAAKFIDEGKIDYNLMFMHGAQIKSKVAGKEDPNSILNFMIRLRNGAGEIQEGTDNKDLQKKYEKIRSKLEILGAKKEVRIDDFNAVAQEVLGLASDSSKKCTKSGFIYAHGKNRFSLHRPHKYGPYVSGKALSDGLDFLKGSFENKTESKD